MTKTINLGLVKVPIENYATQANAILGIKGSGKTTAAKVIAEQLLDAGVPIVVLDPVGMWRYLKVPTEKGGKAYKVVVAGGQAGDLPLTPHTAPEILRSAMRSNIPLVIDLYDIKLSKADWRKIVKSCCDILMFENTGIRHLFLEEAAEYVPQVVRDGDVYAAVEKLARMGGNASVGITLINPRAQEVNKAVLELCELLILMRQKGSHAMAAIDKWLTMAQNVKEVPKTIANLGAGEALVWPESSEPVRTQFSNCITFHPDRKKPDMPKGSIPENVTGFVDALRANLGKIEEELKDNDPAELKRTITDLKRKLAQAEQKQPEVKQERVEVPVLTDEDRRAFEKARSAASELVIKIENETSHLWSALGHVQTFIKDVDDRLNKISDFQMAQVAVQRTRSVAVQPRTAPVTPRKPSPVSNNGHLDGAQQKILDTIAMLNRRGLTPNREMVARWMDIHPNGGRYGSNLARLREDGYLNGFDLTDKQPEVYPFPLNQGIPGALDVLDGSSREIVQTLEQNPGRTFTRETLAQTLHIHPNGGRYGSNLARLRTMGLIPERGEIRLTEAAYR